MSFILDALKKSEQERKRDQVPDLQSVQVAVRPFRRSSVVKIVLLSVWAVVTLVLMALWLQQKYRLALVVVDPSDSTTLAASNADLNQRQDQNLLPDQTTQFAPSLPQSSLTRQPIASTQQAIVAESLVNNSAMASESVADVADDWSSAADMQEGTEIIRPRQSRQPLTTQQPALPAPVVAGNEAKAASEDFDYLPELKQMPLDFAASLPPLDFISHLYSSDPASRSVIINGKSWHEQQRIFPDLQLIAIIPDGVVLSYQGKQFRMPVIQDWSGQ